MATKVISDFAAVVTAAGADLLLLKQDTDAVERKLTLTQLDTFIRVPDADGTKDLGSAAKQFQDLFLKRRITFADVAASPTAAGQFQRNGANLEYYNTATRKLYIEGGTDVAVADGGTGVSTLTDGGILLGAGAGAITAMAVLADGSIVVGDGTTAPVALAAFTSSIGTLKHESGGVEANISAVTTGDLIVGSALGAMALNTAMTQAQAEAGTDTTVRGVTAERIKQAINALGASSAATQAEMEAASSTTVYASPGRVQFAPSAVKVWGMWNDAGTLAASYNITSITDSGVGSHTVVIGTDFSSGNYSAIYGTGGSTSYMFSNTKAAGSVAVQNRRVTTEADIDPGDWNVKMCGDQ